LKLVFGRHRNSFLVAYGCILLQLATLDIKDLLKMAQTASDPPCRQSSGTGDVALLLRRSEAEELEDHQACNLGRGCPARRDRQCLGLRRKLCRFSVGITHVGLGRTRQAEL